VYCGAGASKRARKAVAAAQVEGDAAEEAAHVEAVGGASTSGGQQNGTHGSAPSLRRADVLVVTLTLAHPTRLFCLAVRDRGRGRRGDGGGGGGGWPFGAARPAPAGSHHFEPDRPGPGREAAAEALQGPSREALAPLT
jgi:hypothetical protein